MKIKLYFDKGNLGRLAVAMIFAAVLFWKIGFSVWALPLFGACYFLFKSLEVELSEKIPWVWTGLMIGASSIFTAYHVQYLLLDAELRAKITQPKMLLNILCCLVVFLAVQVFTNNTGLTCMISHIFLVSLAGINYFVYLFRGNEFIFSDLKSIQTGLSVAGNYEFVMDDRAGYVILISTLYVALIRKLHVSFKKRVPMAIICISLAVLSGVYIGHKTEYIVTETWEQKGSYRNGYILNFVLSIRDCFIAAPGGYSSEAVKALEEQYSGGDSGGKKQGEKDAASAYADVAADPGEKPTIIVVMSESYADLSVVGDFSTNIDVAPYFHSLKENAIHGYALSSVFGAKTPNSEWEFMTGNSMAFLPSGSVVYQQYISKTPTSIVSNLKNDGYTCVAMHPYYETGWSRNAVYPDLGFDETHFIDDFEQTKLLREYITDRELYEKIIDRYESRAANEDLFIMSISMQNHGGYDETTNGEDYEPDVKLNYDEEYPYAETYLSLARQSDLAFKDLLTYFEKVDEPTMIVIFGDHWPQLEDGFFEQLLGKKKSSLETIESQITYTTPYSIWTNYPSETKEEDISCNYLGSSMLEKAGVQLTEYEQFLANLKEELPIIGVGAVCDKDGNWYTMDDLPEKYQTLLNEYQILQYNNQFEKKQIRESAFTVE